MCNKISTWNKWDLHLHTRASKNRKGNGEYFGDGNSFSEKEIKEFVDNIFYDDGPTLVGITDHDYFDIEQFKKIKEKVRVKSNQLKRNLNVLPGVEYDVKFKLTDAGKLFETFDDEKKAKDSARVHCVIIFNDDQDSQANEIYNKINKITLRLYPNDDTPVYIDTLVQGLVDAKLEFIIIPHFTKNRGIEHALPDNAPRMAETKTNWILCDYFPLLDGKQSDFIHGKIKHIYEETSRRLNGHAIPIILTSDNHDYREYEKSFKSEEKKTLSYYKALPTFKGLKMCISDFNQRVKQEYHDISNPYISKIEIYNNKKPDDVQKIEFSSALNCVIGGRSSGKSFLLKKIYDKATNNPTNKKDLENYKGLSDYSVKLYDNAGKEYIGKPDFYSQGSIIEKYNADKNGITLQQEFKEYFPKTFDEEKIRNDKYFLKTSMLNYNQCLMNISDIKKDISSRKSIDYLKINSDIHVNFITCEKMELRNVKITKALSNLKTFKSNLVNNIELLNPFPNLREEAKDFIQKIEQEIEVVTKWKNIYDKILECSKSCLNKINETMSDSTKKQKNQIMTLKSFTSKVVDYCNYNEEATKIIDKIRNFIATLKATDTVSKNMGQFKFSVKLTNNLKITLLLDCFNEYLKNKVKATNFENLLKKVNDVGYEKYTTKDLDQLLTDALNQAYSIDYLIYEKNELINEMSEGRKVGVFINLLLTKEETIEPLIIDQPEDDMDNADIYKILVKTIRETKSKRQIIFATHDSNIVVNGDSENVVYAQKIRKNILSYKNGALEYEDNDFNVQKKICETLEGGERAFITRANKYDINKLKLYGWRENYEGENE